MPAAASAGPLEHLREVGSAHPGIGGQAVDLRLVEQQEHRAGAADAVVLVCAVQARFGAALGMQLSDPIAGAQHQIVVVAEFDRRGGAGLGAGRRLVLEQAVVAEGAFLGDAGDGLV